MSRIYFAVWSGNGQAPQYKAFPEDERAAAIEKAESWDNQTEPGDHVDVVWVDDDLSMGRVEPWEK